MYSNIGNYLGINTRVIQPVKTASTKQSGAISYTSNPIVRPAFSGIHHSIAIQTQLNTPKDMQMYSDLIKNLDAESRKDLNFLLKTGILLNNNSNDHSNTLDNLHSMLTTPRANGLDAKNLVSETVRTLANPFVISQKFGNLPEKMENVLVDYTTKNSTDSQVRNCAKDNIDVKYSGCCVAASIEYNLASQMPAEFARIVSGISSENKSVTKEISLNNLCSNRADAIWLLDNFNIPYQIKGDKAVITLNPDANANIRAYIQTVDKDENERSSVDVLMQSTFMNVGSQQTYDSLSDRRVGKFSDSDKGLVELEKTFTESVVTDKSKTSLTYQVVGASTDESGAQVPQLQGYTIDANSIKRSLLNSLALGENVIIGYTDVDENNNIINGHEITIVGTKLANDGKLIFVCNDTDDSNPNPIEYHEDYIIPRIHHLGLPEEVVNADVHLSAIA